MKSLTILWSCTLILLMGCSTTFYLPRDPGAGEFVEAMDKMEGRSSIVYSIEGNEFDLERLTFRTDSLVGYDPSNDVEIVLPLSRVDEIVLTSVLRGIGRGAFRGIVIGNQDARYIGDAGVMGVAMGVVPGAIAGAFALSTEHYRVVTKGDARIVKKEKSDPPATSQMITLNSWPIQEETAEAISIFWDRKLIRLPKSRIAIERLPGGLINLKVPMKLLEPPQEK